MGETVEILDSDDVESIVNQVLEGNDFVTKDDLPDFDDFVKTSVYDFEILEELAGYAKEIREHGAKFGDGTFKDAVDERIANAFEQGVGWMLENIQPIIKTAVREALTERDIQWRKEKDALIAVRDLAAAKTDAPRGLLKRIADVVANALL